MTAQTATRKVRKDASAEASKTFTAAALKAEKGRRRNNAKAKRAAKAAGIDPKTLKLPKAASWVFPSMLTADIDQVLAGELVVVPFTKRTEVVGLAPEAPKPAKKATRKKVAAKK